MRSFMTALKLFLLLTFVTGVIYPFATTALGKLFFRHQVEGSFIEFEEKIIGSELIGQKFSSERYFWGRPSATDYNPLPSGGSNLAPTAKKLKDFTTEQRARFSTSPMVPEVMLFTSASGLDPDITPKAAEIQIERVLSARGWSASRTIELVELIKKNTTKKQFGFLGERRVNVLRLNMSLDKLK